MDEHTQGPWEVRPDRAPEGRERGWIEIVAVGRKPVVDCMSFERRRGGETETHCGVRIGEANARLIAAAPELLDICQEAIGEIAMRHGDAELIARMTDIVARAKGI